MQPHRRSSTASDTSLKGVENAAIRRGVSLGIGQGSLADHHGLTFNGRVVLLGELILNELDRQCRLSYATASHYNTVKPKGAKCECVSARGSMKPVSLDIPANDRDGGWRILCATRSILPERLRPPVGQKCKRYPQFVFSEKLCVHDGRIAGPIRAIRLAQLSGRGRNTAGSRRSARESSRPWSKLAPSVGRGV